MRKTLKPPKGKTFGTMADLKPVHHVGDITICQAAHQELDEIPGVKSQDVYFVMLPNSKVLSLGVPHTYKDALHIAGLMWIGWQGWKAAIDATTELIPQEDAPEPRPAPTKPTADVDSPDWINRVRWV